MADQKKVDEAVQKAKEAEARRQQERDKAQQDAQRKQDEAAKAPLGSPENPMRMVQVGAPATGGDEPTFGLGLTPKQAAGLEPIDTVKDAEENAKRDELPNRQTSFEASNAIDPISGTPSPGINERGGIGLTGVTQGQLPTDMSGRPPLQSGDEDYVPVIRQKLQDAKKQDKDNGVAEAQQGWRSPADMGIQAGTVRRLFENGGDKVMESATVPNGHFFPESGTRYRLK